MPLQQMKRALERIDEFAAKQGGGWFTKFSRAEVARDVKSRVLAPIAVYQRDSMHCGPAALAYGLASDQPDKYVKFVTDLYDYGCTLIGRGNTGIDSIRPGEQLRTYRPPGNSFQSADWIFMASIRDSSNWFFDIDTPSDSIMQAGTSPREMYWWIMRCGYMNVEDHTRLYGGKEELLHLAQSYYSRKHRVFLWVNSAVLNDPTSSWSIKPNHFAVLASPIKIGRDTVQMKVWSWRQEIDWSLATGNRNVSKQNFLDHYYGFFAAQY